MGDTNTMSWCMYCGCDGLDWLWISSAFFQCNLHTHTHIYIYISHIHTLTYTHMCIYIYIYTNEYLCAYMCVYMYDYVKVKVQHFDGAVLFCPMLSSPTAQQWEWFDQFDQFEVYGLGLFHIKAMTSEFWLWSCAHFPGKPRLKVPMRSTARTLT